MPPGLQQALGPVLQQIAEMTLKIKQYDRQIQLLTQTEYPETQALLKVQGVGRVELERAQQASRGRPCELVRRELPTLSCDTLSGRLYFYFECLRVGVSGFTALVARRTSSFVNTAKMNGCDSRK
jgi:hypothetical protein